MGDVVTVAGPDVHLPPPSSLTADQAEVWRETVGARSGDFFGQDVAPLLEEYCRVVVMCRLLALQVEAAIAGGDAAEIKASLQLRDMESRRLTSIATKLRITNQSRYTPDSAKARPTKGAGGKVWQFGAKTGG